MARMIIAAGWQIYMPANLQDSLFPLKSMYIHVSTEYIFLSSKTLCTDKSMLWVYVHDEEVIQQRRKKSYARREFLGVLNNAYIMHRSLRVTGV